MSRIATEMFRGAALVRLDANLAAARERERRATTAEERTDAARTVAYLEEDIRALRAKKEAA